MNPIRWKSWNALDVVVLFGIFTSLISLAAWITHVVVCIRTANWGFLIAGAVAFPVGVVHGIGVWLNVW